MSGGPGIDANGRDASGRDASGLDVAGIAAALRATAAGPVLAVPGGGASLAVLDAVADAGGDVVTVHHEATAAIAAGAVGRLAGRPGVAVAIKGPGLANLLPGLGLADLEGRPVLALVEAHAPGSTAVHKRMDHAALVAGVARALAGGGDAAAITAGARLAASERPGPVVLELLPPDVAPAATAPAAAAVPTGAATGAAPDTRALAAARRPVVVAGSAAFRAGWADALGRAGVPVATTAAAKGLVDERRVPAAGVVTGAGGPRAPETALLAEADLVIGVGLDPRELLGRLTGPAVIAVDPHAVAPAAVLDVLRSDGWDLDAVHGRLTGLRDALVAADPFLPAAVLAAVSARLPDARLVVDTGDHCTIAEHVWLATDPAGFLGAGASRWMGTGLPTALGAALHDPARPTVLSVGDGGLASFAELTLAAERRLPLLVVVLDDGGFASIRGRALAQGRRTAPLEHPPRRWARAAEALGLAAVEVAGRGAPAGLDAALAGWRPTEGPLLVHCRLDRDAYLAMTEGLR